MLLIGRGTKPCASICCHPVKDRKLVLLGRQIRRLREERNVSQEDFAGLADVDRAYYGGIERGERNVAALNLIRIADALNVEVGKLFPPISALRRATGKGNGC
jgi:transcriptional regulator with XRE-family HTH domain